MITALDTNVLMDVLIPNAEFARTSQRRLDDALSEGALVICEVVYAELAVHFPSREEQDDFLAATRIQLLASRRAALQDAAAAWRRYLEQRGGRLQCPRCGTEQGVTCPQSGHALAPRQHILADFLVGSHALQHADRLLTRDLGYYKRYFTGLALLPPATSVP